MCHLKWALCPAQCYIRREQSQQWMFLIVLIIFQKRQILHIVKCGIRLPTTKKIVEKILFDRSNYAVVIILTKLHSNLPTKSLERLSLADGWPPFDILVTRTKFNEWNPTWADLYKQICDALHNLVPFVQFKEWEKHPWRSVTLKTPMKQPSS